MRVLERECAAAEGRGEVAPEEQAQAQVAVREDAHVEPAGRAYVRWVRLRAGDGAGADEDGDGDGDGAGGARGRKAGLSRRERERLKREEEERLLRELEAAISIPRDLTPEGAKALSLYELLGLSHVTFSATPELIRRAYHKAILVYHPDKAMGAENARAERHRQRRRGRAGVGEQDEDGDDADQDDDADGNADADESNDTDNSNDDGDGDEEEEEDSVFLTIQAAYDTLIHPDRRRSYDSQLDFDDSVPAADEARRRGFYRVFGPAFDRNARFAVKTPVPRLGDEDTPIEQVLSFYRYWTNFESWRDFSMAEDMHSFEDMEEAGCREERRWMMRENDRKLKDLKKKEYRRLNALVSNARASDPRLARYQEQQAEQKREAQERKAAEARAREEATAKEAEAARQRQQQQEEEEQRRKADEKAQREQEKNLLRVQRRRLRALVTQSSEQVPADTALLEEQEVQEICTTLTRDELDAFCTRLDALANPVGVLDACRAELARLHEERERRVAEATENQRKRLAEQEERKRERLLQQLASWTPEELGVLAKAVVRFPAGTHHRWQRIAEHISLGGTPRTKEECIAQFQQQQANPLAPPKMRNAGIAAQAAGAAPVPAAAATATATRPSPAAAVAAPPAPPSTETAATDGGWTQEEQQQLEAGLAQYPASMDKQERWRAIAAVVPTRTKKECFDRYKQLRAAVQAKKKQQAS